MSEPALFDGYEPPAPAPSLDRSKLTERDMLDRLTERYGRMVWNGPATTLRYIGARHVRFGPGWPSCIADYLAMDCWGNTGPEHQRHPLLGFEVKISRSDYLREIRDLSKSEPFRRVCTEWYIVVSDPAIVRGDLPDTGQVEVVAKICNGCLEQLHPGWGCPKCVWDMTETRTFMDPQPVPLFTLIAPCQEHA